MFGLDRYDCPATLVDDFANDTGSTYTFLMNANSIGQEYNSSMRYWIINEEGRVAFRSGEHVLDVDRMQDVIEPLLLNLDVSDPSPEQQPAEFELVTAYPNPFNGSVTIRMNLPRTQRVQVVVHDVLGREVAVLQDGTMTVGQSNLSWTPGDVAAGMFFLRVQSEDGQQIRKLMYVK